MTPSNTRLLLVQVANFTLPKRRENKRSKNKKGPWALVRGKKHTKTRLRNGLHSTQSPIGQIVDRFLKILALAQPLFVFFSFLYCCLTKQDPFEASRAHVYFAQHHWARADLLRQCYLWLNGAAIYLSKVAWHVDSNSHLQFNRQRKLEAQLFVRERERINKYQTWVSVKVQTY